MTSVILTLKRWIKSKELLERAIDLDPNLASAHYKLGILFQSENDFNSSLTYFEQAVKINPSFPEAECELAIELGRQGRFEDAREHFLNSLELEPNFVKAHNYALLLVELNDIEEAKNNFDKVAEIDQNYVRHAYKATSHQS